MHDHDPFGRGVRLPPDLAEAARRERDTAQRLVNEAAEFEQRVEWFDQVMRELLEGEPSPARLAVAGAMLRFLQAGGDLQKHLGLTPRRGSKITASRVWHHLQRRRRP